MTPTISYETLALILYGIHNRLRGAGLAHLGQRPSGLLRGVVFRAFEGHEAIVEHNDVSVPAIREGHLGERKEVVLRLGD